MEINENWHRENRMAKNPSKNDRIGWNLNYSKMCKCRPIPRNLLEEIKKLDRQK